MRKNKRMKYTYTMLVVSLLLVGMLGCNNNEVAGEAETEVVSEEIVLSEDAGVGESDETEVVSEEVVLSEDAGVSESDETESDVDVTEESEDATGHNSIYVDEAKLISEKEALDIAYDFYYGDSDVKEYSVYCEELPYLMTEDAPYLQKLLGRSYAGTDKTGYVVYQSAGEDGMAQEKYDPANPSPEKNKWILYSLGRTENETYYVFWLYQYVSDGDGDYHLTTGDYCIVSYDGSIVVAESRDSMGNYIEDWESYNDLDAYVNPFGSKGTEDLN